MSDLPANFTRHELAATVSRRLKIPAKRAYQFVDVCLNAMTAAMCNRQRIELRNFGVFEVVTRKPKIGRNPQKPKDGQYLIPERRAVKFRMGKVLCDLLNQS